MSKQYSPPRWRWAQDSHPLRLHYEWLNPDGSVVGDQVVDRRPYLLLILPVLVMTGLMLWQSSGSGVWQILAWVAVAVLGLLLALRVALIALLEGSLASSRRSFERVESSSR